MDANTIIQTLLGIVGAGLTMVVKVLWGRTVTNAEAVQKAHDDLTKFRVEAAEKYVRNETLKTIRDEIIGHLDRLETKLDRKADK